MSIYATLWNLKFPLFGQWHSGCEWAEVLAQGVPAHIGEDRDDVSLAFLPPREHAIDNGLRAVVFVRALQPKGTNRSAQEYPNPLLALTGKEYSAISFDELHATLTNALRGVRPKVIGEVIAPGGSVRVLYEVGHSQSCDNGGEA